MSGIEVKQVCPFVSLGEGPHWNCNDDSLLWVDIRSGEVHRYFTKTERHQVLRVDNSGTSGTVSLVVPVEGSKDHFVITIGASVAFVKWTEDDPDHHIVKSSIFVSVDEAFPRNRFNDGKCDPAGRLWAGTMAEESSPGKLDMHKGSLYLIGDTKSAIRKIPDVSISNGLVWSHNLKTFYFIDSLQYAIHGYDYNNETGEISNKRVVFDYKTVGLEPDIPDGMTIDVDGNLWVANFFGKKVICVDPKTAKILHKIEVPATCTTSVCWGGPNMDILYVTSATPGAPEAELKSNIAGGTFAITGLKTKGLPHANFKVDLTIMESIMEN